MEAAKLLFLALSAASKKQFHDAGTLLCQAANMPDSAELADSLYELATSAGPGVGQEMPVAAPDYTGADDLHEHPVPGEELVVPEEDTEAYKEQQESEGVMRRISLLSDDDRMGDEAVEQLEVSASSGVSLKQSYTIRQAPAGYVRGANVAASAMLSLSEDLPGTTGDGATVVNEMEAEGPRSEANEFDGTTETNPEDEEFDDALVGDESQGQGADDIDFIEDEDMLMSEIDPDIPGEPLIPAAFSVVRT